MLGASLIFRSDTYDLPMHVLNYYANSKCSVTMCKCYAMLYMNADMLAKSMAINGVCLHEKVVNNDEAA